MVSIWDTCHSTAFTVVLYNLVVDPRFPKRGRDTNPLFLPNFPESYMKFRKKNGLEVTSLAPLVSVNGTTENPHSVRLA